MKRDFHRNGTTINSPVTKNNPSQNISDSSTQKQLRSQINNVPKSANVDLKVTSATKLQLLEMCHLRHRLRIFLFRRKVMFRSQDIHFFAF